nr:Ferrous iron transport periplasmic protein EfeO [Raoultella sp. NCTC 9187]
MPVKTTTRRRRKIRNSPASTRLEKALFGDNSTKGMESYADRLNSDVLELQKRISELGVPAV